ncbi:hypothetical protein TWF718_007752 [Orbilia javanica]|uniref:Uncharacterized protein n=1 Tax=Orbilia javanica TaxID=47235 RepID=A0AAN8MW05_9PEZI
MSSFRNFAFPKKKTENTDASKSPHLRPFLLNLPREEAMAAINSSRPPKRVDRSTFTQMNVPARDRPGAPGRGTRNDPSNQPKIYVPFAPQPSDLAKLMAPQKPGAKCQKCNSNIVLSKVLKEDGRPNVLNAHLGEVSTVTQGQDDNGAPITVEMVWACRINRHVFPSATNRTAPVTQKLIVDPKTGAPKRLTYAGAQRWVNEMRELMRRGETARAKECMTQIVLMNEGMKKESFSWLEKEKAIRLSASLSLPKKITLQQEQKPQDKGKELEKPDEEESEKPEEHMEHEEHEGPDEGAKLLKKFFDEEGATIYKMITDDDTDVDYSGIDLDSSSESNPPEMVLTANDTTTGQPSIVPDAKSAVAVVTSTQENNPPDDQSTKTSVSTSIASNASQDPPASMASEDASTSKRLSKRFSLTNILTGFKKVSPSIKRIEGKHDLGKYAEEQAAAAASAAAMLPAQGETMSLHEMLQEPFHRIAEESLKDLSGSCKVVSSSSSTTTTSAQPEMPEHSLANLSNEGIQSDTPSFVTDKSGNGNDSAQDIERGLAVVTITSEASGNEGGNPEG